MGEVRRRSVLGGAAGAAALTAMPVEAATGSSSRDPGMRPVALTTEHVPAPLGIGVGAPRFGWRLVAGGTGRAQTAYQIVVAHAPELLGEDRPDVWDSGRVPSDRQTAVVYGGPPLESRTRYFWAVRVWDEAGRPSVTSEAAWFETAILESEWTAAWIGSGTTLPRPTRTLPPMQYEPTELRPARTLGQTFASATPVAAVAVNLRAGEAPAGCVMTVRGEGPDGPVLGRRRLADLTGEAQGRVDLPEPAAPGRFYVELAELSVSRAASESSGSVSWLGVGRDVYPEGSAHVDGAPVQGDRWVYGLPPDPPPDPLLRKEFDLTEPVASARLYVCGLGLAVSWINGRQVGDAELSPVGTDYDRRAFYTTHDVTRLLRVGRNALGIALGRGSYATRAADSDGSNLARWIAEPRLKAQLELTLPDGRRVTIGSGPDWQIADGPTTYDGLYTGESYDGIRARALRGWASPGSDDGDLGSWRAATVVDGPGGRLQPYAAESIRAADEVRPVGVTTPADGVRLYDFGVVLAGRARLRARLPEGTTVRMLYSEKLGPTGRIEVGAPGGNDNPSVVGRFQVDEYTAAGQGEETWQASFTYKGFRYVEVTGTSQPVDLVAVPVQSDLADTMELRVEHPVLQWIADAFRRTACNSLRGHPTISPMYTKLGWTSATYRATQPLLYQFDMAGLFETWLDDIRLSQAPDGEVPLIAPHGSPTGGFLLTPSSTGVYPYLVHRYWLTYGDRTVPERHFDGVRRYIEWLLGKLRKGLADDQFGDWYPPRPREHPAAPEGGKLVGTAYAVRSLRDGIALAELLGRRDWATRWRTHRDRMIRRFTKEFLDTRSGHYRTDIDAGYRQTSNAVPLAFGLVPAAHVAAVADGLAADVEARRQHLDTGALGTDALPYALSDTGHGTLALAVLGQRDYPSYGYLRELGATTLWESWEADSRGHNDTTLSSPVRWLVERVLGVQLLEPGWRRFRVRPRAFGDLPGARVALDTVRGRVDVDWRQRGGMLTLRVRVPVNAVAELHLPDGSQHELGSGRHRVESTLG